jgi:hypothetical protein
VSAGLAALGASLFGGIGASIANTARFLGFGQNVPPGENMEPGQNIVPGQNWVPAGAAYARSVGAQMVQSPNGGMGNAGKIPGRGMPNMPVGIDSGQASAEHIRKLIGKMWAAANRGMRLINGARNPKAREKLAKDLGNTLTTLIKLLVRCSNMLMPTPETDMHNFWNEGSISMSKT